MASAEPKFIMGIWGKAASGVHSESRAKPKTERLPALECSKKAAFLGVLGTWSETANPKLALCKSAQVPKPQCYGPLLNISGVL